MVRCHDGMEPQAAAGADGPKTQPTLEAGEVPRAVELPRTRSGRGGLRHAQEGLLNFSGDVGPAKA